MSAVSRRRVRQEVVLASPSSARRRVRVRRRSGGLPDWMQVDGHLYALTPITLPGDLPLYVRAEDPEVAVASIARAYRRDPEDLWRVLARRRPAADALRVSAPPRYRATNLSRRP